jgi:hypothetical protein
LGVIISFDGCSRALLAWQSIGATRWRRYMSGWDYGALAAPKERTFQHEFLFASGATITVRISTVCLSPNACRQTENEVAHWAIRLETACCCVTYKLQYES